MQFTTTMLRLYGVLMASFTIANSLPVNNGSSLANVIDSLNTATQGSSSSHSLQDVLGLLESVQTSSAPTTVDDAYNRLSTAFQQSPKPKNLWSSLGRLFASGLTTINNIKDALSIDTVANDNGGPNGLRNKNIAKPKTPIYPKSSRSDAPYSLKEEDLRAAIHIPDTFRFGRRGIKPAILVPGSGNTGYQTFRGNMIPLLQNSNLADPVWLNIPDQLLGDAQVNAEYVAYAINYISSIASSDVSVITWSQGGLITQWALKYFPSTRSKVCDFVAFSPDFAGTVLANLIDIGEPLPPAVRQQQADSTYISTLRSGGGDSAYVPTTTIYSAFFDEIVEPQEDPHASAYIQDARRVGTSNNQVQSVCAGKPAGGFYLHEGTLYNPLGYALLVDALQHDGPGDQRRLDLQSVCSRTVTEGVGLEGFLLSEDAILIAGLSVLMLQGGGVYHEPPLMGYTAAAR